MNLIWGRTRTKYCAESVARHLLRGGVGVGLLVWSLQEGTQPLLAWLAALGAVLAFKGCPLCWSLALIDTVKETLQRGAQS